MTENDKAEKIKHGILIKNLEYLQFLPGVEEDDSPFGALENVDIAQTEPFPWWSS